MDAAPTQWRPLGQMLVDRGLLTPEELEEVLEAQQQSGQPLGQIIVERRLISGPTLALTLAEQCGVELKTDTGFGTGLWSAIQRRHKEENQRRGDLGAVPAPDEPLLAVEQHETLNLLAEAAGPGPQIASPTAGHAEEEPRVIELEQALVERKGRVVALEAAERAHRQELEQLSKELADREARLREMTARGIEIEAARAQLAAANARVGELEEALQERQGRVEVLEAEEHTRTQGQAGQGKEREAVTRERAKLRAGLESLKREQQELASRQRSLRDKAASVDRRARELSKQLDQVKREQNAITERTNDVLERDLALEARTAELADRERDLDAWMQQVEAASVEIADRARELAERDQAIAGRQRAILTAAADLEQRRSSLEERERALAQRDAENEQQSNEPGKRVAARVWSLRPPHDVVPSSTEVREFAERHMPTSPERPNPAEGYRWNLNALSRLVEESADDFPDRVDDWRYTLFYLRNEARIDGALPREFDSLVEECFGELLGTRDRVPLPESGTISSGRFG